MRDLAYVLIITLAAVWSSHHISGQCVKCLKRLFPLTVLRGSCFTGEKNQGIECLCLVLKVTWLITDSPGIKSQVMLFYPSSQES